MRALIVALILGTAACSSSGSTPTADPYDAYLANLAHLVAWCHGSSVQPCA